MDPNRMAFAVITAARRWLSTRRTLKRLLDSKSASEDQVRKAKKAYDKACTELETLTAKFEHMLKTRGIAAPLTKAPGGQAFPWRNFVGMVAEVARAAETALGSKPTQGTAEVIDTTGESVD